LLFKRVFHVQCVFIILFAVAVDDDVLLVVVVFVVVVVVVAVGFLTLYHAICIMSFNIVIIMLLCLCYITFFNAAHTHRCRSR
jgi:hypothetical protein